ncbi:Para-nitrobenzyl esterase-like protein [Cladobotryum mycophilum]|uniref:Carboxylic ester hydrolase n=1 Tax=Cladobotryum mycophilum TaxID=491253 RepID=A0ABR0STD0_9HYPO
MFVRSLITSTLLLSGAVAVPEVVDVGYSKYQGQALSNGVSQWLRIRYAAAPVGDLRFKAPQDPPHTEDVQMATEHGKYCLGTGRSPTDNATSEDCLFLDVQAPTTATPTSKLPVFLYIQGGGFSINSNPNTNASGLIMASDYNIVVVSLNYRVGPYGFMYDGKTIPLNNGLRDQRKVMEWVHNNIAKFGGDPKHVVLGGSSAGAASVSFHLTSRNGTAKKFFHGAIAESPSFATTLTVAQSQYQYRQFATRLGCVGKDTLDCLRNKTVEELQQQNFNIPLPGGANPPNYMWLPVLDDDFVPDYTYKLFKKGKFLKVPTIYGDDNNGGTKFAPRTLSTLADSNQYVLDQYPSLTSEMLGEINELYPNPNQTCPSEGCYWRHAANVYQETRYMCPGLYISSIVTKAGKNAWAYRWNVEDPAQMKSGLGVPHTVELAALWGADYFPDPPASYKKGGINEDASPTMQYYWINFIRYLNPNGPDGSSEYSEWTKWSNKAEARLTFGTGGKAEMEPVDDGLKTRCDFWIKNAISLTQ